MKKINKILTFIVVLTLCVICGFKKTDVNAASAALTGPGTVRAAVHLPMEELWAQQS